MSTQKIKIIPVSAENMSVYKERIGELYKLSFSDSDDYVDYFLTKKLDTSSGTLLVDSETDELYSMAFMSVRHVRVLNEAYDIPYLFACATHPDQRGKQLMTSLLVCFLLALRELGFPFVMLHPFDHEYYKRLGFETVDYLYGHSVRCGSDIVRIAKSTDDFALCARLFEENLSRFDAGTVRYKTEWEQKLEELFSDSGSLYLVYSSGGTPKGYVMESDGTVEETVMLAPFATFDPALTGRELRSSLKSREVYLNNQIRILNAEKTLSIFFADSESNFTLSLTDPQVSANSGIYSICDGACNKLSEEEADGVIADASLDIMTLTRYLFGACAEDEIPAELSRFFCKRCAAFFDKY